MSPLHLPLLSLCPPSQGRIVGGQVAIGRTLISARLWLYDLQTGQIAYQDDYCEGCDLISALTVQVQHLMEHPNFGARPGPAPSYCAAGAAATARSVAAGPFFLTVYGEGKHKAALHAALRSQLGATGRQVLPVGSEPKSYTTDVLQKIVAGHDGAQVLAAEVRKDGQVLLFLYDGKTDISADKLLECSTCAGDKDVLVARVQPEVTALLEHCFGEQCATNGGGRQPPGEACQQYTEEMCPGEELLLMPGAPAASGSASAGLDARSAKLIKGLTWSAFAASAATAITLFAITGTSAGTYYPSSGGFVKNNLDGPAWAMLGVSGALLGVSIPITLVVDHAATRKTQNPLPATQPALIQCPN